MGEPTRVFGPPVWVVGTLPSGVFSFYRLLFVLFFSAFLPTLFCIGALLSLSSRLPRWGQCKDSHNVNFSRNSAKQEPTSRWSLFQLPSTPSNTISLHYFALLSLLSVVGFCHSFAALFVVCCPLLALVSTTVLSCEKGSCGGS